MKYYALGENVEFLKTENASILKINLAKDHVDLDQHFPNLPVVPAYMQLNWVISLLRRAQIKAPIKRFYDIKFHLPINPPNIIFLELRPLTDFKYAFKVSKELQLFTKGNLELSQ